MRNPCLVVFVLGFFASIGCAAKPTQELFNGRDLSGWEFVAVPATDIGTVGKVLPAGSIDFAGSPVGYIATTATYRNYRLHVEYRWRDKPGNGGVLVHISSGPKDKAWPLCIQIQTKYQSAGDLLPMAGSKFAEPLEPNQKIPRRARIGIDSEKPVGEWNSYDIICLNDNIEVFVNGVAQNRATAVSPSSGRIGFQFEGTPFELRQVTIETLD